MFKFLNAVKYFDVKIEYVDITKEEFEEKINQFKNNLDRLFEESKTKETKIHKKLSYLNYE